MIEKQSVKDTIMWYDRDALIDYIHASECRRFELYLQFPKLRYLFDEIESPFRGYAKPSSQRRRGYDPDALPAKQDLRHDPDSSLPDAKFVA